MPPHPAKAHTGARIGANCLFRLGAFAVIAVAGVSFPYGWMAVQKFPMPIGDFAADGYFGWLALAGLGEGLRLPVPAR